MHRSRKPFAAIAAACLIASLAAPAPVRASAPGDPAPAPARRDGSRDFDFEIGTWHTRLARLAKPLSGSDEWIEYTGTTTVRKVWDGRANLVELVADGPDGHFEGLNLRLYDPRSGQWRLNFANSRNGVLTPPTIGGFTDGRGEFYDQEDFDGRAVFVRFLILPQGPDTIRFEQAFSTDGGRTWETNWIATDTRVPATASR
ncbi:MAG: hypothetical protein ACTHOC_11460 [Luteimonas sp.]